MYRTFRESTSRYAAVRTATYHVRCWGHAERHDAPLVLLHGWMDSSASWQFFVDAMAQERRVLAPDWRGFGLTRDAVPGDRSAVDCYWAPDLVADLDFLLDALVPDGPVDLVGHSMGGNVALTYAGIRPERVRSVVSVEGYGMPATGPSEAPGRYVKWIDELKALYRGDKAPPAFDSAQAVAQRLMKNNPRLDRARAEWLASQWSAVGADGLRRILANPGHTVIAAQLYRVDEVTAIHAQIRSPALWIGAADDTLSRIWGGRLSTEEHFARLGHVPGLKIIRIPDTGHMLHHDQPLTLAEVIDEFQRNATTMGRT